MIWYCMAIYYMVLYGITWYGVPGMASLDGIVWYADGHWNWPGQSNMCTIIIHVHCTDYTLQHIPQTTQLLCIVWKWSQESTYNWPFGLVFSSFINTRLRQQLVNNKNHLNGHNFFAGQAESGHLDLGGSSLRLLLPRPPGGDDTWLRGNLF